MKNHRASESESKRASYNESRSATEFGAKGKVAQEPRSKRARRTASVTLESNRARSTIT